jgi:hypothetical protein
MRAASSSHFSLLILIILIIFGEEYTLWNSSLYSLLQPPVTSTFLGPNIFLSALFSKACVLPVMWGARFHRHTKQHVWLYSGYSEIKEPG